MLLVVTLVTTAVWATLWLEVETQATGIDKLQLAGLYKDATLRFDYYGKNFGTVVFSIKDSYGLGLRVSLHHNKGCTKKESPFISFNTITNSSSGHPDIIPVSEIKINTFESDSPFVSGLYGWEVITEIDGYFIVQKDYFNAFDIPEFVHFFPYRSPHVISDIKEVTIEELEVCETKSYKAFIYLEQKIIPYFSKVIVEGRDANNVGRTTFFTLDFDKSVSINAFITTKEMSADLQTETEFTEVCSTRSISIDPVTRQTKLGVTIIRSGYSFQITISVGDVSKTCSFSKRLNSRQLKNTVLKPYLNYISEFVQY